MEQTDEWNHISTAPKNGAVIRVRGGGYSCTVFWDKKNKIWATYIFGCMQRVDGYWDESKTKIEEWAKVPA